MRDPRNARLADLVIRHSTQLQKGEAVFIEAFDVADGLVLDLVDAAHAAGGIPVVSLRSNAVNRALWNRASEKQFELMSALELFQMQQVQAYVGLRGAETSRNSPTWRRIASPSTRSSCSGRCTWTTA